MFIVPLHTHSLLISTSPLHCRHFFCGACHCCLLPFTASPATTCCCRYFSSHCHVHRLPGHHFYRDRRPTFVLFCRALLHPPFQMSSESVQNNFEESVDKPLQKFVTRKDKIEGVEILNFN
ncbi:hypothetical protein HN51_032444, partial [Arachis hypogaea]